MTRNGGLIGELVVSGYTSDMFPHYLSQFTKKTKASIDII